MNVKRARVRQGAIAIKMFFFIMFDYCETKKKLKNLSFIQIFQNKKLNYLLVQMALLDFHQHLCILSVFLPLKGKNSVPDHFLFLIPTEQRDCF